MERLLQQLRDLWDRVESVETVPFKELKMYQNVLREITTITGQSTAHLFIPDAELEKGYKRQFDPMSDEVVDEELIHLSMKGSGFREYLKRAIAFANELKQNHS